MNYDDWKTTNPDDETLGNAPQSPRIHWKASDPCPPIPIRDYDYVAWYEGEEDGPWGWGRTPEAAKADLQENYVSEEEARASIARNDQLIKELEEREARAWSGSTLEAHKEGSAQSAHLKREKRGD